MALRGFWIHRHSSGLYVVHAGFIDSGFWVYRQGMGLHSWKVAEGKLDGRYAPLLPRDGARLEGHVQSSAFHVFPDQHAGSAGVDATPPAGHRA